MKERAKTNLLQVIITDVLRFVEKREKSEEIYRNATGEMINCTDS